jgi:lipopolysaccharide export system protein LptC
LYRPNFKTLAFCVLAAAAIATWYYSRQGEPAAPTVATVEERPPSYYLRDAEVLQTNDDGRLLYRIHAEYAEDRPDDAALVLDDVLFEYRDAEQIPWHVRAARAVVWFERQLLELENGVELVREPRENGEAAVVRTEKLVIDPVRYVARAEGEVTFMLGASTLTAIGLEAFLKEDRLKLESDIRGRFRR